MSNKAINKDYLLRQLKNFNDDILSETYSVIPVEMTQAQYDALTQEEKMNGTIYLITDASGGGGGSITIDTELSSTSKNAVQNKVIYEFVNNLKNSLDYYASIIDKEILLPKTALKFSSDDNFVLSASKKWDGQLEYSIDNCNTWTEWDGSQLSSTAMRPIYIRGTGNSVISGSSSKKLNFTGKYCTGNIENLLDYQTVANGQHPTMGAYCYASMFSGCTSLMLAPELPATTLTNSCYDGMFNNCTSLTTAPKLPATTLATYCYMRMFSGCESLTVAPTLPATTLADSCYNNMFYGCTSLKLSTTKADEYQYAYRIPITGTGTTASNALYNMFDLTGGTFQGTPNINTTYYTTNPPVQ